jgi:hypothetical protein
MHCNCNLTLNTRLCRDTNVLYLTYVILVIDTYVNEFITAKITAINNGDHVTLNFFILSVAHSIIFFFVSEK